MDAWLRSKKQRTAGAGRQRRRGRPWQAAAPVWLAVALLGGALMSLAPCGQVWALQAAGAFKGQAIGGVEHFVDALKGNLVWLGGTSMGLIIAVVAILFLAGHSRAHDLALKTIIGLAILASISGIVA